MSKRLIPDPQVQERYSISAMTLWRWDHDANLRLPKTTLHPWAQISRRGRA